MWRQHKKTKEVRWHYCPLPYFNNRLVSIGYKWLGEDEVGYDFHTSLQMREGL